eukprot:CAMPEP_0183312074 /NCGR_PEP_ID=MMETSP0160_2-20130417/40089_1 /TAXON_ID=2839 ORGANISM="Odontella Sinensis, Strain Grunow 1884" /NCGR_SAMPLE_ID=MMETSP0160_2 /ASSEMBLY_ACC=CAM_ASM_000250 /LENGTH=240 /DNA_ID=CAMNT_0025476853 /DNA_START=208 /DNA_END=930 /DNA_ORIENTATION=-
MPIRKSNKIILLLISSSFAAAWGIDGPDPSGLTTQLTSTKDNTFLLTTKLYNETDDHQAACVEEYGQGWRVADWEYDLLNMDEVEISDLKASLGIVPTFIEQYYFVTFQGRKHVSYGNYYGNKRVYYFEDHEDNPSDYFFVHHQHGGLSLLSWYGMKGHVLCTNDKLHSDTDDSDAAPIATFIILFAFLCILVYVYSLYIFVQRLRRENNKVAPNVQSEPSKNRDVKEVSPHVDCKLAIV